MINISRKNILSRSKKALLGFFLIAFLLTICSLAYALVPVEKAEPAKSAKSRLDYVPGDVMVMFKEGADPEAVLSTSGVEFTGIERLHSTEPFIANFKQQYKLSGKKGGWYWFKGENYEAIGSIDEDKVFLEAYNSMTPEEKALYRIYNVAIPEGKSVEETVLQLGESTDVEYAEPNYVSEIFYTPPDPSNPLYYLQWPHQVTEIEDAWDTTRGDANVIIAVIDTGVDYSHPDLVSNIWQDGSGNPGKDFVDIYMPAYEELGYESVAGEDYTGEDDDPSDFNGHGTHVAGIIGSAEGDWVGLVGVTHVCKIMPVRAGFSVLDPDLGDTPAEQETGYLENDDIAAAIKYAVDNGASIVNMSFGDTVASQTVRKAIDYALSMNVVLVAAAGNDDSETENYPAAYDDVIAVAATDEFDDKATFSNYGSWVDVSAPGDTIPSTFPLIERYADFFGYAYMSGTSMACPYVAGLAGLLKSEYPYATTDEIKTAIQNGADTMAWPGSGHGRVNCKNAFLLSGIPAIVARAYVSGPEDASVFRGQILKVRGVAWAENFLHYTVEVRANGTGDPWVTTGITLENGGLEPVGEGLLATWDISLFPAAQYDVKLTVVDSVSGSVENIVVVAKTVFGYGNINGAGAVTADDVSLASQYALGALPLTPQQVLAADVDGDGFVTAHDVALINKFFKGLITSFPNEDWD